MNFSEDGYEFSWIANNHVVANCGVGSLTSIYMKKFVDIPPNQRAGWHGAPTREYVQLSLEDKEKIFAILDKHKTAIFAELRNNTILISDRADLGPLATDATYGKHLKAYHFVEWLVSRGHGAVVQSPCAFNHMHAGHVTQVWMWYPRPEVMVDMDLTHLVPKKFKDTAKEIMRGNVDNEHVKSYKEWKAHLEGLIKNAPKEPVEVKQEPVPNLKTAQQRFGWREPDALEQQALPIPNEIPILPNMNYVRAFVGDYERF